MKEVAARLRAARAYAGFTQTELANRIELGEVTYASSERGSRPVPRREPFAIAEACEVPMWFLERGWAGFEDTLIDEVGRRAVLDITEADREARPDERGDDEAGHFHPGRGGARRGSGGGCGTTETACQKAGANPTHACYLQIQREKRETAVTEYGSVKAAREAQHDEQIEEELGEVEEIIKERQAERLANAIEGGP